MRVAAGEQRSAAATSMFDGSFIQQTIVSLVAIKIAGLVLIFDPYGLVSFELPKALFSRATEWLLAGALLIALVRYGTAIVPRSRMHFAVAAIVLTSALSTIFAENRYIALFGEEDHYLGLTFVVDMAVLYLAVAVGFRRRCDWALLGSTLGFVTAMVLAYGAVQYFGLDPLRWNVSSQANPFSTLAHQDALGRYISLAFGASVAVAVLARRDLPVVVRAIATLLAASLLVASAAYTVRGTLVGIAAVLVGLLFVYLRLRAGGRRPVAVVSVGAVVVVVLVAALLALTPVGTRMRNVLRDEATKVRLLHIDTAVREFLDRPLLGYGPDNFAVAYPRYRQPVALTVGHLESDAHNWLLQAAATTGSLGLLALVTAILMSLGATWTAIGRGSLVMGVLLLSSIAYWVHALTTIASPGLDWFPFVAFGAVASRAAREPSARTTHRPTRGVIAPALASILAIVGVLTVAPAFAANRDGAVAAAERSRRPGTAIAASESALRYDSGRAVYWYWLGRARETREEWLAAAAAYMEAATRVPYQATYWARLAQVLTRAAEGGDRSLGAAALDAARRGTELDPNNARSQLALAETAYALGEYLESLQSSVRAVEIWPEGNGDVLAARAAPRVSDALVSRVLLERAVQARDSAPLHLALSQIALKLNDVEAARVHAKRTLELKPGDPDASRILATTGG